MLQVFQSPSLLLSCALISVLWGWQSCKWIHSSIPLVFLGCIVRSRNTGESGDCARTFFRDQWSRAGTAERIRIMNVLYAEFVYCGSKMGFKASTWCLSWFAHCMISSTHSITCTFPLVGSLLLSSPTILLYLCSFSILLLVQSYRFLTEENRGVISFGSKC